MREQVFLLWYKPDPNIVESFVSKSSAYCQYCRCCPESAAKNWKYPNVSEDTTNLLSLLLSWTCYRWYFSHLMLKMTWNTGHWVCVDQRIALYKNYLLLLLSVFECKQVWVLHWAGLQWVLTLLPWFSWTKTKKLLRGGCLKKNYCLSLLISLWLILLLWPPMQWVRCVCVCVHMSSYVGLSGPVAHPAQTRLACSFRVCPAVAEGIKHWPLWVASSLPGTFQIRVYLGLCVCVHVFLA